MTTILALRDLTARTRERILLEPVDLDVCAGRVLAVIGASGAGKTTLGLAMTGESSTGVRLSGTVRLRGRDLVDLSAPRRRALRGSTIGYLPQHPSAILNPARRIGSVLREFATQRCGRTGRDRAVNAAMAAASVPGPEVLRRYPQQLSSGQQQRVALALALISEPSVLVLDEPTTGLDTMTAAEAVRTFHELAAGGTALVLLTHDLGLARRLAHEVVILREGAIVEHGPGTVPLHDPAHPYGRELLASEPRLTAAQQSPVEPGPAETAGLHAQGLVFTTAEGSALLRGIDLHVPRGHCLAVLGRSGAGKTTLARCLAGLTRPDRGRVLLDGRPLAASVEHRDRRQVHYVHQNALGSFDPYRKVLAQVARTAQLLRGLDRGGSLAAAGETLESLGMTARQCHRHPGDLSGGELRRAALARALLARPSVLICDELTSGLDTLTQYRVLEVLARVRSSGTSLVLISHDLAATCSIADAVCVLDDGRCVEHTSMYHLITQPSSATAAELIQAARHFGLHANGLETRS